MLDIKKLIAKILDRLSNTGKIYTASWTATSTNGNVQRCTNSLTLPAGTYIFSVKIPVCSQNKLAFSVMPMDLTVGGWYGNGQVVQTYIWTLTQTTTCYVATSMSNQTNYTYRERGYFRAVRIA